MGWEGLVKILALTCSIDDSRRSAQRYGRSPIDGQPHGNQLGAPEQTAPTSTIERHQVFHVLGPAPGLLCVDRFSGVTAWPRTPELVRSREHDRRVLKIGLYRLKHSCPFYRYW